MERLLIVGIDTAVGANIAVTLADRLQVTGVSQSAAVVEFPHAESLEPTADKLRVLPANADPRALLADAAPDWVVYCGPAAVGLWERLDLGTTEELHDRSAVRWAHATHAAGLPFTFISSDGIFTGPWMFHREDSTCRCPSAPAAALGRTEADVRAAAPRSLIVRTHAIGPNPLCESGGWFETLCSRLESGMPIGGLPTNFATPIAAVELANILEVVLRRGMTGTLHIAGAQRVTLLEFATQLAGRLGLPTPAAPEPFHLSSRPQGFGSGETSLHTGRLRRRLNLAPALLSDTICTLANQRQSSADERIGRTAPAAFVA